MAAILLSDDDAATRELVRRALEGDGHRVRVTSDGGEALEALRAEGEEIDVLVTDVQMPVLDGLSLVASALVAMPGLRVVLMSGHADLLSHGVALEPGQIRTVSKPFTLEQIRSAVRAALA